MPENTENVTVETDVEVVETAVDEPKTGELQKADIMAEAEKLANHIVGRKLKGMPTKEEIADYKAWKESQQTEAERMETVKEEARQAKQEAENIKAEYTAKIEAVALGIKPEFVDDVLILAKAKASDEVTIEKAIAMIADKNPSWMVGSANVGLLGGNPATLPTPNSEADYKAQLDKARKNRDTIEAIRIKGEAHKEGIILF